MVEFKLVINDPKSRRSFSKSVRDHEADIFRGKKIKDLVKGDSLGLKGYELEITGGSDNAGFPMRYDLDTMARKRVLLTKGPGVKINIKGMKKRKTVVGSHVSTNISQINLKIVKEGEKSINEIFNVTENKESKDKEASGG